MDWEPVELDLDPPFVVLTADPGLVGVDIVETLGLLTMKHPGCFRLVVRAGQRDLIFGPDWTFDGADAAAIAALAEFGDVEVRS